MVGIPTNSELRDLYSNLRSCLVGKTPQLPRILPTRFQEPLFHAQLNTHLTKPSGANKQEVDYHVVMHSVSVLSFHRLFLQRHFWIPDFFKIPQIVFFESCGATSTCNWAAVNFGFVVIALNIRLPGHRVINWGRSICGRDLQEVWIDVFGILGDMLKEEGFLVLQYLQTWSHNREQWLHDF